MIDSLVKYTNMYKQHNRTMEGPKKISKNNAKDTCRSEIMAVTGILFFLGYKKVCNIHLDETWALGGKG